MAAKHQKMIYIHINLYFKSYLLSDSHGKESWLDKLEIAHGKNRQDSMVWKRFSL